MIKMVSYSRSLALETPGLPITCGRTVPAYRGARKNGTMSPAKCRNRMVRCLCLSARQVVGSSTSRLMEIVFAESAN